MTNDFHLALEILIESSHHLPLCLLAICLIQNKPCIAHYRHFPITISTIDAFLATKTGVVLDGTAHDLHIVFSFWMAVLFLHVQE